MRRTLLALLFFIVIGLSGCGKSSDSRLDTDGGISRAEVLLLHNRTRLMAGTNQLLFDHVLEERAQTHAEWMAGNGSLTHSHLSMSGTDYRTMGENIAMGFEDAESVLLGWMESTGHRRNILNKNFTHAGFGYARKVNGRPYWCAIFGGK